MDTWEIVEMQRQADDGLVNKILVKVSRQENDINVYENFIVNLNKGEEFISFDDLTQEIVLSWAKEEIHQENIDVILSSKIKNQKSKEVILGKPW